MPKRKKTKNILSERSQRIVLGTLIIGSIAILAGMVLVFPSHDPGSGNIGSNGFSAFVKNNGDIGVANITNKTLVTKALGGDVKGVSDIDVSKVFSLNGNLGQTATFPVLLKNGASGSVVIDMWKYKSEEALKDDAVFKGTGDAGKIDGHAIRYIPASSIGGERSYSLITSNGLTVYRFIVVQPNNKLQIKEYKAQDILKDIISNSTL